MDKKPFFAFAIIILLAAVSVSGASPQESSTVHLLQQLDYNAIDSLSAKIVDGNVLATILCDQNNLKVDFNLINTKTNSLINSMKKVDCNITPMTYILQPQTPPQMLKDGEQYTLTASISEPCKGPGVCKKEAFLYYRAPEAAAPIPDNGFFAVVFVLAVVMALVAFGPAKGRKERV
jgi:hypothetical protein